MTAWHEPLGHHPTETELADLADGALDGDRARAVAGHVEACLACRILLGRLARAPDAPQLAVVLPGSDVAMPEAARAAVLAADRPAVGAKATELWRARRVPGGPATLVWLRAVQRSEAAAVPVSLDVEFADEHTLIVPPADSPLGVPLVLHVAAEVTVDKKFLLDRLGVLDVAPAAELIRAARASGERVQGVGVGTSIVSPVDDRFEFQQFLANSIAEPEPADTADDGWWLVEDRSDRASLLVAIHEALRDSHPRARIAPRPPTMAGAEHLTALALVSEVDAFVLVASRDRPMDGGELLEAARQALHADQLLNAVCVVDAATPYLADVIDRRDIVDAIETPSGELRPPRRSRSPAPLGQALEKFLDVAISPFGRLARTAVESEAVDARDLAVDVVAAAVRAVAQSARGFKVEGKRPGYEQVTRHQATITRLVEAALNDPDVDVASFLEEGE